MKCPKCTCEEIKLEKGKIFCFHCYHPVDARVTKCAKCGKEKLIEYNYRG